MKMRLKPPKPQKMTLAVAEDVAASGLALLAADAPRLNRFLTDSGLNAGETEVLAAVLEHICSDESLLLVFAAERQLTPEQVVAAHIVLSGPRPEYSM
jgi:hypothetical protein